MGAEGEACQYTYLPAGVRTLHVRRGVPLGIAQLLGQLQSLFKAHMLPYHLCEDKVRGAVQNTCYLADLVGGKALADGPYNRYAAAHTGLKEEVQVIPLGQSQKLRTLSRHQFLV